jgi:hypothetical protein
VEQHALIDECHVTAVGEDNQFRAMDERTHFLRERRITLVLVTDRQACRDFDRGETAYSTDFSLRLTGGEGG